MMERSMQCKTWRGGTTRFINKDVTIYDSYNRSGEGRVINTHNSPVAVRRSAEQCGDKRPGIPHYTMACNARNGPLAWIPQRGDVKQGNITTQWASASRHSEIEDIHIFHMKQRHIKQPDPPPSALLSKRNIGQAVSF